MTRVIPERMHADPRKSDGRSFSCKRYPTRITFQNICMPPNGKTIDCMKKQEDMRKKEMKKGRERKKERRKKGKRMKKDAVH